MEVPINEIVLLYFCLGGVFLILSYVLCSGNVERLVVNPGAIFSAYYGVTYFLMPGGTIMSGHYMWVEEGYRIETHLICLAGFVVFGALVLGAWCWHAKRHRYEEKVNAFLHKDQTKPISMGMLLGALSPVLLLSVLSLMALIGNVISSGGLQGYYLNRLTLVQDQGPVYVAIQWWLVLPIPFIYHWQTAASQRDRRLALAFALAVLAGAILIGVLQGSRTRTLFPVALWMVSWIIMASRGRGLSSTLKAALAGTVVSLAALGAILGALRETSITGYGGNAAELAGGKYATESFSEFENALWLIENRAQIDLQGGSTFLAAAVWPVPRALWKDKPMGAGPLMRNLTMPYAFEQGSDDNRSPVTTGLPAESYMNFGLLGFPAMALIYGGFLAFIGWLLGHVQNPFTFGLFTSLMCRSIEFIGMEAVGGVGNLAALAVPFVIMLCTAWIIRRISSRRTDIQKPFIGEQK